MKKKILRDISTNTIQVIINQVSGIVLFYFCSRFLDKGIFGELNWSIAVLITSFSILGFGLDQVMVQKVAAGGEVSALMRLYLIHVLVAGLGFYLLLMAGWVFFPAFYQSHHLLIALGVSQFFLFLSMPFKQIATGKEQFKVLLFMSTLSNVIRAVAVPVIALMDKLTTDWVLIIYIVGASMELILCIYLSRILLSKSIRASVERKQYAQLIRESLPQLGSIIFNAAVARFDWILLGLISTDVVLADYSFAYRAFEVSTLPLLVIGPLLLPKFTRLFHTSGEPDLNGGRGEMFLLLRAELLIACFSALLLNIMWNPIIDMITGNKYGKVNLNNILALSSSIPLLYINNFLWTVNFAKGKLKMLFVIVVITFSINAIGDFALIPLIQGLGAAIAYLAALGVQTVIFMRKTQIKNREKLWQLLLINGGSAFVSGWIGRHFFPALLTRTAVAVAIFLVLVSATGQLRLHQWRTIKSILST